MFAVILFAQTCAIPSWAQGRVELRPSYIYFDFLLQDPSVSFKVTVTGSAIGRTPKWNEQDENPPLSARRAIKLADNLRAKVVKDHEEWKWHLEHASLTPFSESPQGRWYWEISYYAARPVYTGPHNELHLAVLMDGTVVEPEIKKREPQPRRRDRMRKGPSPVRSPAAHSATESHTRPTNPSSPRVSRAVGWRGA